MNAPPADEIEDSEALPVAPTSQHKSSCVSGIPARGSAIPAAASVVPTQSKTPAQGSAVPTTASVAPTHSKTPT